MGIDPTRSSLFRNFPSIFPPNANLPERRSVLRRSVLYQWWLIIQSDPNGFPGFSGSSAYESSALIFSVVMDTLSCVGTDSWMPIHLHLFCNSSRYLPKNSREITHRSVVLFLYTLLIYLSFFLLFYHQECCKELKF